ncbi:TonB-dependent receptor [Undibacterium sp. Ren11W]|uniref:TonB-dependent receptor n=1 Tax=Undibacterium sp. Ren11W TaxID=3413045 RepID=UPI003BF3E157
MRLTKKNMKLLRHSAAALIAVSGTTMAQAQSAPSADTASATSETATVMVTARRREESLQDVPVSVTAFIGDQLAKTGIADLTALAQTLPNTTLSASRGTNSTLTSFIRGVGQQDPVAGYESGVGIYLDDIYLARPQGAVADIYDVERIEVLRGPQGTLYGRNTIGGAVKYVTRKLAPTTEVRLRASVGTYRQMDGVLTASTPISDTVRVGATLAKFTRDGFGTNLTNGDANYNKDLSAGRISVEVTPTTDLFIRLAADTTQDDSNAKQGHRETVGKVSGAPILANSYDTQANLTTVLGHTQQVTQSGVSALIEYNISNELTIKSVTASRHDKSYAPIDFDSLNKVDFDVPALYTNKQFSQEFQATYTGKKIQGVAGVYYIDANAYNKFDARVIGVSIFTEDNIDTKAWAAFADVSADLTDSLTASVGGRYTVDQRQASILRQVYLGTAGSPAMGGPATVLIRTDTNLVNGELERTDKKFTPRVSLGWKASPEQNVYASWTEGFKGGMFDPRMVIGADANAPAALAKRKGVAPEQISTFELGLKSQFNRGRILTNASIFQSDYKDVQIPGSVAIDTNGDGIMDSFTGTLTNAGKAKIKGLELEASARVTDAFTLTGMFSYIDAKYTQFIGPANADLTNLRFFQNTPTKTANLQATYDWPLAMMGRNGKLSLITSVAYRDDALLVDAVAIPMLDQTAYSLWDASLVWTSSDNRLRVGLHGKNLNDTRYKVAGYNNPLLGAEGNVLAFYGNPRTVTATVDYRF